MKRAIFLSAAAALILCGLVSCSSAPSFVPEGSTDIGSIELPGSYVFDEPSGTFTLTASGENMWLEQDAFFFVWKKVEGDFEISGDIAFEGEGFNAHRKLGFIIRESLEPGSRYADIAIHGDGLTSLQYRPQEGAQTEESVSANKAPSTIMLARRGDVIAVRTGNGCLPESDDTSITLEFPQECYVGLFLCSHETDVLETAHFSNVALNFR